MKDFGGSQLTVDTAEVGDAKDVGFAAVGGAGAAELGGGLASLEDAGLLGGLARDGDSGSEGCEGEDDGAILHFDGVGVDLRYVEKIV